MNVLTLLISLNIVIKKILNENFIFHNIGKLLNDFNTFLLTNEILYLTLLFLMKNNIIIYKKNAEFKLNDSLPDSVLYVF